MIFIKISYIFLYAWSIFLNALIFKTCLHIICSCQVLKKTGLNPSECDKRVPNGWINGLQLVSHKSVCKDILVSIYIYAKPALFKVSTFLCVTRSMLWWGKCFGTVDVLVWLMFWYGRCFGAVDVLCGWCFNAVNIWGPSGNVTRWYGWCFYTIKEKISS